MAIDICEHLYKCTSFLAAITMYDFLSIVSQTAAGDVTSLKSLRRDTGSKKEKLNDNSVVTFVHSLSEGLAMAMAFHRIGFPILFFFCLTKLNFSHLTIAAACL